MIINKDGVLYGQGYSSTYKSSETVDKHHPSTIFSFSSKRPLYPKQGMKEGTGFVRIKMSLVLALSTLLCHSSASRRYSFLALMALEGDFACHCLNFQLFPPAHPYVWSMNGPLSLYRKILGNRPQTVTIWVQAKPSLWSKGKKTDVCTQRGVTVHRPLSLAVPSKSNFFTEQYRLKEG